MPSSRSATASRSTNDPAGSPGPRGKECVRKSTFMRSTISDAIGPKLVELTPDLAQLRALASDLFAEQSGGEEDAAENEAGLDERPHRAVADAGGEVHAERDEAGERANAEQPRADHAEEQQRFLSEPQLEPHGEHIEHSNGNAR